MKNPVYKSTFGKKFIREKSNSPIEVPKQNFSTIDARGSKTSRFDESDVRILQSFEKLEIKNQQFSKKFYEENFQIESFKNEKMRAEMQMLKEALSDGLKSLGIIFKGKSKVEGELLLIKLQNVIDS